MDVVFYFEYKAGLIRVQPIVGGIEPSLIPTDVWISSFTFGWNPNLLMSSSNLHGDVVLERDHVPLLGGQAGHVQQSFLYHLLDSVEELC